MPTSSAVTAPADIISAAINDLYDQLKAIVDRGPTTDPKLIDELRQLTRRIGTRISRAAKRQAGAEEPTMPAPSTKSETAPTTSGPATTTATAPASGPRPAPRGVDTPRPVSPATKPREEVSVRLPATATEPRVRPDQPAARHRALPSAQRAVDMTAFGFWKAARSAVAAFALAAVAFLIGVEMADAGAPTWLVTAWGVGCFVAFVVGVCVFAVRASTRWGREYHGQGRHRRSTGRVDRS